MSETSTGTRSSRAAEKEQNLRLLNDPAFQRAVAKEEQSIVMKLAEGRPLSRKQELKQLELVKELQALQRIKRRLFSGASDLVEKQLAQDEDDNEGN